MLIEMHKKQISTDDIISTFPDEITSKENGRDRIKSMI